MKSYYTAEVATLIGVHPNTVRFYEEQELLPPIPRSDKGYRLFTESHLRQLRLIRRAFKAEILNGNLRSEAVAIVKTAATGNHADATRQAGIYRDHIREEIARAREAICLTEQLLGGLQENNADAISIGRREAAAQVGVSIHVVRDWERNGLLTVPRKGNRRQYGTHELDKMKIIFILRGAGYSQMSIRRMLTGLEQGDADLLSTINTPEETEDIISVTDRYIASLSGALADAGAIQRMLDEMRKV